MFLLRRFIMPFVPWLYFPHLVIILRMSQASEEQEAIGAIIRSRRKDLGYSQEGFAHICELDRSHMGRIERGRSNITLVVLLKIAKKLKIKPSEILKQSGI